MYVKAQLIYKTYKDIRYMSIIIIIQLYTYYTWKDTSTAENCIPTRYIYIHDIPV